MKTRMQVGIVDGAVWQPAGYTQITNAPGLVALTPPADAKFALFQPEVTTVRFTDVTSVSPSTSVGLILNPGVNPHLYVGPLDKVQFWITSAVLNINYYK